MEEITFLDVLTHYQLKLKELTDELESMRHRVRLAEAQSEESWQGAASEAMRLHLHTAEEDLSRTLGELSEALTRLTAIGDLLAEEETVI